MKNSTPPIVIIMFVLALLFWTGKPRAAVAEHALVVHTTSYHFNRDLDRNEVNPGVGYRYRPGKAISYQVGVYRNSFNRTAVYAVFQYEVPLSQSIRGGAFAGVISGYDSPVAAGLMASTKNVTIRLIPPAGKAASGVIALEFHKGF